MRHLKLFSAKFGWSEPLRTDNELSNANPWREVNGKNEATL